ncbi:MULTISPECIES: ABC transporter ATP-binding protein [unclassified Janthinobacterium]|uniref:ABC transporter ATP-binding protein n=1 Tax=unclassified Janthinobacterium TaxID=2610881 RepID=UPI000349E7E4|nr:MULTISPECIES: ABC transporter ATP-binding protein [unclassified Janthinobacterium]MEC5163328.1 branched-chain amino acid transport system ATP-binding protein [Janthinobacterium sp. CG_S6]
MNAPLLTLAGVHTHIGPYHILQGVDLEVPRGQLTMLLGRNGAGKSTTLRTIMGLWRASAGSVTFGGAALCGVGTADIAARGIAYVPENMGIFSDLSVRENMLLAARSGPMDGARLEWIVKLFPSIKQFWEKPAGKLSGGQKQMLAIGRALIEPRQLYMFDEPSKGLAPVMVNSMVAALRALKEQGATVLLVEQNLAVAQALGDTVAVMGAGRVVHHGGMAQLAADPDLQQRLLGLHLGAAPARAGEGA